MVPVCSRSSLIWLARRYAVWLRRSSPQAKHLRLWPSRPATCMTPAHQPSGRADNTTCQPHQDRMDSRADRLQKGSLRRSIYKVKTLCCHRSFRHVLLACAKSHRIGSANCFRGELLCTRCCSKGTAPARAASSCRLLLRRHRLYSAFTTGLQISCIYIEL